MPRLITIFAFGLVLGGCAGSGMELAECRTADWRAIGYEDGSQGRKGSALGDRRKACADHGVTPNFEAYMDGHGRGIAEFCRPRNGYQLGTRGYRYRGVCPTNLESAFLTAHADGFGLYRRRAAVNRLSKQITRRHNRSQTIERLMATKTAALVSYQTSPAQRLTIGVQLKQITEERIEIERSISQLEIDLEQAQYEYRNYRESIAQR